MIAEFERRIGRGSLANKVASGTAIIDELGDEHVRTGKPIVYTSADSVFQIAAHEEVVPIDDAVSSGARSRTTSPARARESAASSRGRSSEPRAHGAGRRTAATTR